MEKQYETLLREFRHIMLDTCPDKEDQQLNLFENHRSIRLLFNNYSVLYQYNQHLFKLFSDFKRAFLLCHPSEEHLQELISKMIADLNECRHFFYYTRIHHKKVCLHRLAYMPCHIQEREELSLILKASDFFYAQKNILSLTKKFLDAFSLQKYALYPSMQQLAFEFPNQYQGFPPIPDKTPQGRNVPEHIRWQGKKCYLVELLLVLYYSEMVSAPSLNAFQVAASQFFHFDIGDFKSAVAKIYRRKRNMAIFMSKMTCFFSDFIMNNTGY